MDILGFELNAQQLTAMRKLHVFCAERMATKLPQNINSPRCAAYDKVQSLDAQIVEHAPKLKLQRIDVRRQLNAATGLVEDVKQFTPVRDEDVGRIVWQYYFIANPHRFP